MKSQYSLDVISHLEQETLNQQQETHENPFSARSCCFLPSFGSKAAGPACDGAVYVGEVGVIAGVVPCANLQITTSTQYKTLVRHCRTFTRVHPRVKYI